MLTAQQWDDALASTVHWRDAYATVEREARVYLVERSVTYNAPISTAELVLSLGSGYERGVHKRIFKALSALAEHGLSDCCHRGMAKKLGRTGTMIRPWLWHAPLGQHGPRCPHCGGVLA